MLEVSGLSVRYGVALAVRDATLRVQQGELVALVGANGAGKTSTLLGISGVLPGCSGTVMLSGERLDRLSPDKIAAAGVVHVPEGRQLYADMTVLENIELGAYLRTARKRRRESLAEVLDLMPRLADRLSQRAGSLSGGEQQMVALARGLMAAPKLLILDEPTLGLAPIYVTNVFETIARIRMSGTSILLVEQNVNRALAMADRGYVMQAGSIVMDGPAQELISRPDLAAAFLGTN